MSIEDVAREAASQVGGDPGVEVPKFRRRQAFIVALSADHLSATIRFPESTQDLVKIPFMHQHLNPNVGDTVWVDKIGGDTVIASCYGISPGLVMMDAGSTPPAGWLLCNGQSTTGYPLLASRVGANVPDMRDRFVVGAGTLYALDATGGNRDGHSHALGSLDSAATGDHAHSTPDHAHPGADGQSFITDGGTNAEVTRGSDSFQTKSNTGTSGAGTTGTTGSHDHTLTGRVGKTTGNDGDADGSNVPPYYSLFYVIKHD